MGSAPRDHRPEEWDTQREGTNQLTYGQAAAHEFARSEVLDGFEECQDTPAAVRSRAAGRR